MLTIDAPSQRMSKVDIELRREGWRLVIAFLSGGALFLGGLVIAMRWLPTCQ